MFTFCLFAGECIIYRHLIGSNNSLYCLYNLSIWSCLFYLVGEPGQLGQYSDFVTSGLSGVRFPAGKEIFFLQNLYIGSGVYPASYLRATRSSFFGGKAAGAWCWPLLSFSVVKAEWSCTPPCPVSLHGVNKENFTFFVWLLAFLPSYFLTIHSGRLVSISVVLGRFRLRIWSWRPTVLIEISCILVPSGQMRASNIFEQTTFSSFHILSRSSVSFYVRRYENRN